MSSSILTEPTKSAVIPVTTNSIPTAHLKLVLIPRTSSSLLTVPTKPAVIPVITNSIPTAHSKPMLIPRTPSSLLTVPSKPAVIPVITNSIPTAHSKPVLIPRTSSSLLTVPTKPAVIPVITNSIPTAHSKPVLIPRTSSSKMTIPTKPVVIPIITHSIPTVQTNAAVKQVQAKPMVMPSNSTLTAPTKTAVIPVITHSIPTVQTSRVVNSTVRNFAPTELSKMKYVVKFNFCCSWGGKTFENVDNFKTHAYYCKPDKPPVSTGVLTGNGSQTLQSLIPVNLSGNMPSSSITFGGIKPSGLLFIPSSFVSVNHGGNKSGSASDRLGRLELSEVRPDTSSENVTTSTAYRLSMSASVNIDLTENEVETASSTKTGPSELSDNLSGNSAFSTSMTHVCPLPEPMSSTGENEWENDIKLPVCPLPAPISP